MSDHPFYNAEIKPLLVVVNILMGLLFPFFLILGIMALFIKPAQIYFSANPRWFEGIIVMLIGAGMPISIAWSLWTTWKRFRSSQFREAFMAAIFPIVFATGAIILFIIIYLADVIAEWLS